MAKAEIIEDLGSGQYTIKRVWAGREAVQTKIDAYNAEIATLQAQYDTMPTTTDEELFAKHIVGLQIKVFEKKVTYFTDNFPEDETVDAWCVDYTEGLTGEVGTIDIAGEKTTDVNIRPNGIASNAYNGSRDGELYPGIALGPWTSFLNQCIYPGWQRFKPLHRYAWILEDTIDYAANTCAVAIQPTFSLMNYNVNKAATGGGEEPGAAGPKSSKITNFNVNLKHGMTFEEITLFRKGVLETKAASEFYVQNAAMVHPGFLDFVDRNPDHPISNVTQLAPPIYITDEQYIQLKRICKHFDYHFGYQSDQSGYKIADYWDVMYDIGDPWYWYQSYEGEPQTELTFGDINLISRYTWGDRVGGITKIDGSPFTLEDYYLWGTYSDKNISLEFETDQLHILGPDQKRSGDCEDFVLTKMQAIIESGIIPAENLQVLLCYVRYAGYHAVLGVQTANRGFLISDQRAYGQLWEIDQLSGSHSWESFSVATAAGEASEVVKWAKSQFIIKGVPFEYMECNSDAFGGGEEVVIEFTDQDWDQPKVIGFKEDPRKCTNIYVFPGQQQWKYESESRTMRLSYHSNSWAWKPAFSRQHGLGRLSYAATGEGGLGFTVGGVETDFAGALVPSFNELDIFDSTSETFSTGQSHPQEKAGLGFESLKNGKCLSTGGGDYQGYGQSIRPSIVYSSTHEYTIASNSWATKASSAKAVYDHATFVIDGTCFSVGGSKLIGFDEYNPLIASDPRTNAYNADSDAWYGRQECPQNSFLHVNGYNLEGKGLVGGGGYIDSPSEATNGETYLYDKASDSWTAKSTSVESYGTHATSTAVAENVALKFGSSLAGTLTHWYDYKLSTNTWRDRGVFDLTVSDDPLYYSHRDGAAGAEL